MNTAIAPDVHRAHEFSAQTNTELSMRVLQQDEHAAVLVA